LSERDPSLESIREFIVVSRAAILRDRRRILGGFQPFRNNEFTPSLPPDRKAFELGGYQTWTGLHSFADPDTGERMVLEAFNLLTELASKQ
jgi:hypothetical protein